MASFESDRPIGTILQDMLADFSALMRSEIALAKSEIKSDAAELIRLAPLLAIGAIMGLFALAYLLTAALLALTIVIPPWAASLVIFGLAALVGGAAASTAKARLRKIKLKPERTMRTIKENAEWLKTQTR